MNKNKKFIADVESFAGKTKDQLLRVARKSIEDVIRDAQTPVSRGGNLPVLTSILRNSLEVTVGGATDTGADSYILGVAKLQLGDPFQVAWTADYAIPRHYAVGVGQGGGLWRDKAAQKWAGIVEKNARAVQ